MTRKKMKGAFTSRQALTARQALAARIIPLLALGLGACSLLAEFNSVQCERDEDCEARGNAFSGTICQANFCVTPNTESGGQGSGGSSGGTSAGGGNSLGGMGGAAECEENVDCIVKNFGNPYLCREEKCVPLTLQSGQCPAVLGGGDDLERLKKYQNPILFGAYSTVDPVDPFSSPFTLNIEFAVEEINRFLGDGLVVNKQVRPLIAVLCDGQRDPDLDESMQHLVDLGVPAVVPFLSATDLRNVFLEYGLDNDIFFLSPVDADSTLTNPQLDNGLMWHMLPPASDLAVAYPDLVARAEAHVRALRGMDPATPFRVTIIESEVQANVDLTTAIAGSIQFNGAGALSAANDGNFLRLQIDSTLDVEAPEIDEAVLQVFAFEPHLLITVGYGEMAQFIEKVESGWKVDWADCPAPGSCPPFHIVSYGTWQSKFLSEIVYTSMYSRLFGVNYAGNEDTTLYDELVSKLELKYGTDLNLAGRENFYDAIYHVAFAIAAASGKDDMTGRDVRDGMAQIIDLFSQVIKVGRQSQVTQGIGLLQVGTSIQLEGTMGLPDFNTQTGARRGLPSVYCMIKGESGAAASYVQDALRYDPETQTLTGDQPCVPDFPTAAP